MWRVYFVIAVGALISCLVLGWATYLERSGAGHARAAFGDNVPLPVAKPRKVSQDFVDDETVRELKDGKMPHRARQHRGRPRATW